MTKEIDRQAREQALEAIKKLQAYAPVVPFSKEAFIFQFLTDTAVPQYTVEQAAQLFDSMWRRGIIYESRSGLYKKT